MLRVTVEIFPGGNENGSRVLAYADIANVKSGPLADYEIRLSDEILGDVGAATLRGYPRMAATIWDLVGRSVAIALTGTEELPPRPELPNVPVYSSKGHKPTPYVRFSEIPEPARTLFKRNMSSSTCPVIEDEPDPTDCAYAWDWTAFLAGSR
ncbi:hypothetical protein P0D69_21805 [Paraburkholderia sediminicola]|uniref:hypothetical protein n=1 Tax=Paraburkholderia sediminicola TaxID=458836 RepID=UPI0038BAE071